MVPVSGPVAMIILFSGDSGSTLGSVSSQRYLVPRPREPRYSSAHFMFRGSGVQVPAVRLTRRIFLFQLIFVSLGCGGSVGLGGPGAHAVQPGPVGVDIGDGAGRAGLGAFGVAAAEVAFLDLADVGHVIDC